ncbi:FtsX-like permease family protein [Mucilaginibacter yixingensis]|uniref:FtsX-like permease family protein n=1 Tax=Mucilaginibacter yixingensis TaxID=1295612 RepID=A0A2T5JGK6_9SPHI|nr:ABC transporter permease [Mucilaginibacter yixingensis]PTR01524.1 FtsX-like permease family protein [Mucilaginibacter yixingensis]
MLTNYLKIAWRNLWKNKIFSIINLLGLAVGIAFAMLIGAYVWGELQVNRSIKDCDNQYVIQSKWKNPNIGIEATSVAALPKALKENYPSLIANYYNSALAFTNVSKNDKHFRERLQVGDSTLLNMYGFKLLYGDAKSAFTGPFSVVITTEIANKYFGKTDVIGQTLNIEDFAGGNHDYIVTGVLDKIPANTITGLDGDNKFQFFVNGSLNKSLRTLDGWDNSGITCYIELQKGVKSTDVERAMLDLINKNETDDEIRGNLTPYLVPIKDYHLQANNNLVKKMTGTLCCVAFFILLMATINFVNICIGRSSGRMQEMGIRKVIGGLRKHLIIQFLAESVLTVMLSTVLALIIYILARPYFSGALGRDIFRILDFPAYFILIPIAFSLLMGLLAGIYPALVLSALGTIDSLKGKLSFVKEHVWLRKMLIAFQFVTAAIVVIGAIIISQQISLFFNGNLGYDKDYVVYAQAPRNWSLKGIQKIESIRSQLALLPQVSSATLSWEIPDGMDVEWRKNNVYKQGTSALQGITTQNLVVDNQFVNTFNIPLKAGQFFNPLIAADSSSVVINETERKALGWNSAADALQQKIIYLDKVFTICGVTADFHFASMHEPIQPLLYTNVYFIKQYRYLSFRLKPGHLQQNIDALQKRWSELMPQAPFEYHFMDDALTKLYATEIQLKKTAYIATTLAIVIVLLGVIGLISLSIQKRIKEIGIRRILGSSVSGISFLFLKEFLSIVLIACIIACPFAYIIMQHWLNDYAYRVAITPSPFVVAIIGLTLITMLLIWIQIIKAALANPIKSLRSE